MFPEDRCILNQQRQKGESAGQGVRRAAEAPGGYSGSQRPSYVSFPGEPRQSLAPLKPIRGSPAAHQHGPGPCGPGYSERKRAWAAVATCAGRGEFLPVHTGLRSTLQCGVCSVGDTHTHTLPYLLLFFCVRSPLPSPPGVQLEGE